MNQYFMKKCTKTKFDRYKKYRVRIHVANFADFGDSLFRKKFLFRQCPNLRKYCACIKYGVSRICPLYIDTKIKLKGDDER